MALGDHDASVNSLVLRECADQAVAVLAAERTSSKQAFIEQMHGHTVNNYFKIHTYSARLGKYELKIGWEFRRFSSRNQFRFCPAR